MLTSLRLMRGLVKKAHAHKPEANERAGEEGRMLTSLTTGAPSLGPHLPRKTERTDIF